MRQGVDQRLVFVQFLRRRFGKQLGDPEHAAGGVENVVKEDTLQHAPPFLVGNVGDGKGGEGASVHGEGPGRDPQVEAVAIGARDAAFAHGTPPAQAGHHTLQRAALAAELAGAAAARLHMSVLAIHRLPHTQAEDLLRLLHAQDGGGRFVGKDDLALFVEDEEHIG